MGFRRLTGFLALVLISGSLLAQDIHFSQYFASPLNLNPALTGGFNGTFRAVANYRNQDFGVQGKSSYQTYAASVDASLLKRKLNYDRLGVGVSFFHDKSGDGGLSQLNIMAAAAYHKALDDGNRYSLSLGVKAGLVQKRIDFSKLVFEDQIVDFETIDPVTGETLQSNNNIMYVDFEVGLLFRGAFTENIRSYIGGSFAHVHKPKENFIEGAPEENRLDPRYIIHGGTDFRLADRITLTPGVMYMIQSTAQELNIGLVAGLELNDFNALYFGSYYRVTERALMPMVAYEIAGFRAGISYDVTLSDYRNANGGNGAIEVSLIYIYGNEPEPPVSNTNFCPKW